MPSPIVHAAVGVVVSRFTRDTVLGDRRVAGRIPLIAIVCMGLSLLPDLDAAVGIFLGNLGKYHNNLAGSPLFATLVTAVVGGIVWVARRDAARQAFALTFVCYQLHVILDFFTVGRGVMLAWPFSDTRFQPPFHLFFGLRWSHGLISPSHLTTLATEAALVALLYFVLRALSARGARRPKD